MSQLTFYFDFLSPYSYLAWTWVRDFCREEGLDLRLEPVVLGALLSHYGTLGPAEVPAKREWVFRDCLRGARTLGIETLTMPASHPFNPLPSLRAATRAAAQDAQVEVVDALWDAAWQRGIEMSDTAALVEALDGRGLDGASIVARAVSDEAKAELRTSTETAISHGVFGVPSFRVEGELFWGNDQRQALHAWVSEGDRGYDPEVLRAMLESPAGIVRKR